jgi:hypothetical protein
VSKRRDLHFGDVFVPRYQKELAAPTTVLMFVAWKNLSIASEWNAHCIWLVDSTYGPPGHPDSFNPEGWHLLENE